MGNRNLFTGRRCRCLRDRAAVEGRGMTAALVTAILAWVCFMTAMFTAERGGFIHRWSQALGLALVACWMMGQ